MATYFLWGSIGLIVLLLGIGFLVGMYRGLKRTALHILFVLVSVVIAFFVTRPITDAILNANINYEGTLMSISEYIVQLISENLVDLSHFDSASEFIKQLPNAVASPIVFIVVMLVMFLIFEIIYLITARISFGTKRKDFSENKPRRLPGGFIAMAETFMFFLVLFAPITSLTHTYEEIVTSSTSTSETVTMPTLGDELSSALPPEVNEAIFAFNDSAFGVICSAGGFDDALFDGLSDVKIDGEKINVRKEIVTLAGAYDDVATFVNEVSANNFETLNFAPIKASVTEVVNNNLFKTVLTDTLKDFIVNFDTIKDELGLTDIPEEVVDIIHDLQAKMTEDFDFYTYLSSDILSVLDIADNIITSGTLEEYMNLENVDAENVLNLVVNNEEAVSSSLKSALTMNLVSDTLPRLLELLSSELQKGFENAENIGLNTTLTREDMESMVDSLMSIATELKSLNDQNDIFGLIESEDIVDSILNLNDIGGVLDGLGGVLDEAHSLKILNFERESVSYNTLDGILESMGFKLIGDDVHVTDGTLATIDTYSDFFGYIKTLILSIKEAGLTAILDESADFDAVLNIIKTEVQKDDEFLAKLIMPFYDLDKTSFNDQTLKAMVFDTVIDQLSANLDGFIKLKDGEDTYENYYAKLASIGELLNELSSNSITVTEDSGEVTYDYFDYIMLDNADYFALISDMQEKNVIDNILTLLFENNMYSPLHEKIFPQIDSELGGITGVTPTTDYSNIAEKSDTYIEVIKALLDVINDESMNSDKITDKLPVIGKVLDTLKVSAESGVFDDVFVNIIWYLTGDVIDNNPIYVGQQANSEYERIKEYLGVTEVSTGYYEIASYEEIMNEIVSVIELADRLSTDLGEIDIENPEGVSNFVSTFKQIIDELYGDDITSATEVIGNASKLANDLLTGDEVSEYGDEIASAIDIVFESDVSDENRELANAIKALLGVTNGAESGI